MQVLITGANRGLGLEFTRQLLARGDQVIATARKPAGATALNKLSSNHPGQLTVLGFESGAPESTDELLRGVGALTKSLDLFIANAGVLKRGETFGDVRQADLEHSLRVNAIGPMLLTQALTPLLALGTSPRVVFISSVLGSIGARDSFYVPSYCISKAALNMAMRVLSFALSEQHIIATAVHPGWVRTDMGGDQAPLLAPDAVSGLLTLIDALTSAHHGGFFAHDGRELAW